MDDLIKIVVLGPKGVGKSQFCNFILKDITNSVCKVIRRPNGRSDTVEPQSVTVKRQDIFLELIDTPGIMSEDDDEKIKSLVEHLKKKKEINQILLLCNFFAGRIDLFYLKILSSLFTPIQFISNVMIIFTHCDKEINEKYSRKEIQKKNIKEMFNKIFVINPGFKIPDIPMYFLDIDIDDEKNNFDNDSLLASNDLIEELKLRINSPFYSPINTSNLEYNEQNIVQKIETEKLKIMKEVSDLKNNKEKRERLNMNLQMEKKRYNNFMNNRESKQRDTLGNGIISLGECLLKLIEED